MKKNRKLKNKIAIALCASILPLSASGMVCTLQDNMVAKAETTTASYAKSYVKELNLSNGNFNSSSSTYTLSSSPTGWTGHDKKGGTTAGIINTGTTFQTYMSGTYRLSNNPLAKATDKHILMINSKTSSSGDYDTARQGYKSSSVTLDANSYYSFQVSFKSDTNYKSRTAYQQKGIIESNTTISKETFNGKSNSDPLVFGDDTYISFTYRSKTYYLLKNLTEFGTLSNGLAEYYAENIATFYEDEKYVGVLLDTDGSGLKPYYVLKTDTEDPTEGDGKINVKNDVKGYTCDLEYDSEAKNYKLSTGTKYFETTTVYDPISSTSFGSIYLDGLKDADGNDLKAEYTQVSSKDWTTFYFFIATGNESQTVNLDLWLGSKNISTNGVVFFDDCHVVQYSENAFWKTYQANYDKSYTQEYSSTGSITEEVTTLCTSLVDLREDKSLDFSSHNFDFEQGIYNEAISSLQNWKKDEQCGGSARVFDVDNAKYFKSVTGYDFVGSNLASKVVLENEEVLSNGDLTERLKVTAIKDNKYVLALWAKDDYVKVTSDNIDISANEIYKITAYYKISELENGNVYLFVNENDNVLSSYNLTSEQYSVSAEVASSAITSNANNDILNDYGTIEFYVKGGALYNSSVNLSLGLGKSGETATGCVVFDDITIEKASTSEYSSASNKIELGTISATPSITNGNFNTVTISDDDTRPFDADGWTITSGDGITFGGVINTDAKQYEKYVSAYEANKSAGISDAENPYAWAKTNPLNAFDKDEPDNILMLANLSNSWQKVKSDNISLSASTNYCLSFNYKTVSTDTSTTFKITLYGKDGFKLFESEEISSQNWAEEKIYLKSFSGASEIYAEIDFGTSDAKKSGYVYLDNFKLKSDATIPDGGTIVDMTDFYLNLPSNDITDDVFTTSTPGYTGSISSGSASGISGGIVKSEMFGEESKFTLDEEESKKVFYIQSQGQGAYTIQSNFQLDLAANTYYKLSFKLKTYFDGSEMDSEKTYSYGATVGLTGFDYMTELRSPDEYGTYTIYFHPKSETSANLYIALICDSNETAGAMALYDVDFVETDEDEFASAQTTSSAKDFDINEDKVFVASTDETTTDDTETDTDTTTSSNETGFDWLLIPTLIFGLAIVIAVVGFFMRKIKIKKIEIKKKESYDRKTSLNVNAIKEKAKKEKDAQIQQVQNTLGKFEKELETLEKEHKAKVVSQRVQDQGKLSKETDKEFKSFARKRTVIAEKIDSLKKQIDEINTPEYLLNLERKIYAEQETRQRELAKASKKANDKKAKDAKNAEKAVKENSTIKKSKKETTDKKTDKKNSNKKK